MIPPFALIVTAAGSSTRFCEEEVKKEFLKLDGHTVLYRATEPFFEIPSLAAVVITTKEGCEDEALVALEDLVDVNSIPMLITKGGKTRQESVHLALEKLNELGIPFQFVAVQDGARPYVKPDLVIQILAAASQVGGAIPALPTTDSLRRIDKNGLICECIDRRGVVSVQTPQIFDFERLLTAHRAAKDNMGTDDAELFVNAGFACTVVEGDKENIKITYLSDIPDAEAQIKEYIKDRSEGRKNKEALKLFNKFVHEGELENR